MIHTTNCTTRPKSKYADWEEAPQEGETFNFEAAPEHFYFEVESVGNHDPDEIIQQGIKVLQKKFAEILQELDTSNNNNADGMDGMDGLDGLGGPRSPDGMPPNGGAAWNNDQGFTTPYANGNAGGWAAGGGTTPYGATPYGQPNAGW